MSDQSAHEFLTTLQELTTEFKLLMEWRRKGDRDGEWQRDVDGNLMEYAGKGIKSDYGMWADTMRNWESQWGVLTDVVGNRCWDWN